MISPFNVAARTAENVGGAFERGRENSKIETILTEAMQSGDQKVLQDSLAKILTQVSPERQPAVVKALESEMIRIDKKQTMEKQQNAAKNLNIDPNVLNLPTNLQGEYLKQEAKNKRLTDSFGDQMISNPEINNGQVMQVGGEKVQPNSLQVPSSANDVRKKRLLQLTGSPDVETRNRAAAELKQISDDEKITQDKLNAKIKSHRDISQDVLKENEKEASSLIQSESALALMEDAIANKDLSFFSKDNLAEVLGVEGLRSTEGALFKTAGKEFFLGNLNRAGARPNQFIEKQIVEMLPKIGRSTAANLSVARAFRNEIDLKKEKVRLTRDLANELETTLGYVPRNIGQLRDEKLRTYAEQKQKELNNDLRAYVAIEDGKTQTYTHVQPGTPISKPVAKALYNQFLKGNDTERAKKDARNYAKVLGYEY